MNCILEGRRKAVLYSEGRNIYYLFLTAGRRSFPVPVAQDYQTDLSACTFSGEYCFSYMDLQGKISFRRLGEERGHLLYRQMWEIGSSCGEIIRPALVRCGERCFLFYLEKQEEEEKGRLVLMDVDRTGEQSILEEGNGLTDYLVWKHLGECELLLFKENGRISTWKWNGRAFLQAEELWKQGNVAEKEEILTRKFEKKCAEICRHYEKQISDLQAQYEELAQVTRQLQEAGKKWREVYFEEF